MTPLKYVRLEQEGETLIVSPLFTFGRFTEGDLVHEWDQVLRRIDGPEVKHVIVDLGQIPYFGSTLLEWMVQMWKRAKEKGPLLPPATPRTSAVKSWRSRISTIFGGSIPRVARH